MDSIFAGIAVLAAIGSFFFGDRSDPKTAPSWVVLATSVVAACFGLFAIQHAQSPDAPPLSMAFGSGALAVLVCGVIDRFAKPPPAVSVALGCLVALFGQVGGTASCVQASIAGAAIVALVVGSDSAMATAFASSGLVGLNFFAKSSDNQSAGPAAKIAALLAVASLIPLLAGRFKVPSVVSSICVPLFLAVVAATAVSSSGNGQLGQFIFLPLLAGLAAHWLLTDDGVSTKPATNLIVGLLWLGGATLAFALMKSAGLALWLVLGAGVPLVLGNNVALGSAAPFAALTWYRLVQSDLTAGSDLSRFYVLTGLAAGIGLVAAGWEWRGRVEGLAGAVGGGLWAFLAGGVALLAGVVFGPRGFVGVLEGSGLGSMLGGSHRRPLTPMILSAVMASIGALCLAGVHQTSPYGRDEKTRLFVSAIAAVLVVAGVLYALQMNKGKEEAK